MFTAVNLPLKAGATDEPFLGLFEKVFGLAMEAFKPDVVVLCCGCDALGGDPLGRLNLSSRGIAQAVKHASGFKEIRIERVRESWRERKITLMMMLMMIYVYI
jgi:acetoin utilization deacetylase AcuC-like enzyme